MCVGVRRIKQTRYASQGEWDESWIQQCVIQHALVSLSHTILLSAILSRIRGVLYIQPCVSSIAHHLHASVWELNSITLEKNMLHIRQLMSLNWDLETKQNILFPVYNSQG